MRWPRRSSSARTRRRHAVLHRHEADAIRLIARRFGAAVEAIARGVAGGLQVQVVVDEVDDDLHVALRLHVAAHHAEREPGLAVAQREGGDDGLERAPARRVDVRDARSRARTIRRGLAA